MNAESRVAVRAYRKREIILGVVAIAAAATFLLVPIATRAVDPGGSGKAGKSHEVTVESISGSKAKRITLSAKAAERLGIMTSKVGEEQIVRKQMVSGLIVPPLEKVPEQQLPSNGFGGYGPAAPPQPKPTSGGFGGFGKVAVVTAPPPAAAPATPPVDGEVWVLVTLSQGELERLALDKPARLLPLDTRNKLANAVFAVPSGIPPLEDMKRSMLSLYYKVPGKDHGLTLKNRMRVELQLSGSDERQKVVPYSAVYYDASGAAWVYVNAKPLTYERQRIAVERVVGDRAVLSDGPPIGTPVVTVGAALLYGAEIFGK